MGQLQAEAQVRSSMLGQAQGEAAATRAALAQAQASLECLQTEAQELRVRGEGWKRMWGKGGRGEGGRGEGGRSNVVSLTVNK